MYQFVLKNDNAILEVQNDPIGWDEGTFNFKRSKTDGDGVFKSFTIGLTWVKDGADFIKTIYELEGIEANIEVEIYVQDASVLKWVQVLVGRLNLSDYDVDLSRGRLEVRAPIEFEDAIVRFLNLRDKKVNFSSAKNYLGSAIPAASHITSLMHTKPLEESYDAGLANDVLNTFINSVNIGASEPGDVSRNVVNEFWIPFSMDQINKDTLQTPFQLGTGSTTDFENLPNFFQFAFDTKAQIIISIPQTIELRFDADNNKGRVNCGSDGYLFESFIYEYIFEWRDKDNNVKEQTLIADRSNSLCGAGAIQSGENIYFDTVQALDGSCRYEPGTEYDFKKGDKLYLYVHVRHEGNYHRLVLESYNVTQIFNITVPVSELFTYIRINGVSEYEETECEGIMVYEAFNQIATSLIGQVNSFKSNYLGRTDLGYAEDGEGALRMLTRGKNVRGRSIEDSFISASFNELLRDGFDAIDGMSFGFEYNDEGRIILRVEPIEYFYNTDNLITLENVSALSKKVLKEKFQTNINLGYSKWTGQKDVGTIFEINSTRQFYTGITKLNNTEDKISNLVTGSYAIESTRRLVIQSNEQDGEYDEDLFCICVLRTGGDPAWRSESDENLVSSQGIANTKNYNLRLSPVRNLIRLGRIFASTFFKNDQLSGKFEFTSGEGNFNVDYELQGEQNVYEGEDLDVDQFTPIWINEVYTFEYPMTLDEWKIIKQAPNKLITFTYNGTKFYGFIMDMNVNLQSPGSSKSEFKLLRAWR